MKRTLCSLMIIGACLLVLTGSAWATDYFGFQTITGGSWRASIATYTTTNRDAVTAFICPGAGGSLHFVTELSAYLKSAGGTAGVVRMAIHSADRSTFIAQWSASATISSTTAGWVVGPGTFTDRLGSVIRPVLVGGTHYSISYNVATGNADSSIYRVANGGTLSTWSNASQDYTSTGFPNTLPGTSDTTYDYCMRVGVVDAPSPLDITITTPVSFQIFQRDVNGYANIPITGTYNGSPAGLEASFNGGAYSTIVASPSAGSYSGTLSTQVQGQGLLTVRWTDDHSKYAMISYVGIGDVFVIIGDSIAEGRLTNPQVYTGSLMATMFKNPNWAELKDPTDPDTVTYSFWPNLATKILASQTGVPVAFITCATGSTLLTGVGAAWPKGGSSYTNMANIIAASGVNSIKAFLMHIGTNDSASGSPPSRSTFSTAAKLLASNLVADYPGSKLFLVQTGWVDLGDGHLNAIRLGELDAWSDVNIKRGPVMWDVQVNTDGQHYAATATGAIISNRWWDAINEAFYGGAAGSSHGPIVTGISLGGDLKTVTVTFAAPTAPVLPATGVAGFTVYDNGSSVPIDSVTASGSNVTINLHNTIAGVMTISLASELIGGAKSPTATQAVPTDSSTDLLPADPIILSELDVTAPGITITSPTSSSTYTAPAAAITLGGVAADGVGVTSVTWTCDKCTVTSGTASGTTAWTQTLMLGSGANAIVVTAHDAAGNTGTDSLTATYTAPAAGGKGSMLLIRHKEKK